MSGSRSTRLDRSPRSLRLRRGDEILANTHTYNAVRQTILNVCERTGARLVDARMDFFVERAA